MKKNLKLILFIISIFTFLIGIYLFIKYNNKKFLHIVAISEIIFLFMLYYSKIFKNIKNHNRIFVIISHFLNILLIVFCFTGLLKSKNNIKILFFVIGLTFGMMSLILYFDDYTKISE